MAARYLLRFDDICPGMNWPIWRTVEAILLEAEVRPLLAIVPDNLDPELNIGQPDPMFWDRVRGWQELGWSIALHGYQHRKNEFAGTPESEQRQKLKKALKILRDQQIRPDGWAAPPHCFDQTTIRLLAEERLDCISAGYALLPYVCAHGMFWVPQQLRGFHRAPCGAWTVCLHINLWQSADLERFRSAIQQFRSSLVSLGDLRWRYRQRSRRWPDALCHTCFRAAGRVREWTAAGGR